MSPKKHLFDPAFADVDTALAQLAAAMDRFVCSYPADARRLVDPNVPTRDLALVSTVHLRIVLTESLADPFIIDPDRVAPADGADALATANSDASVLAALVALGPHLVETATEVQQRLIAIEAHRFARANSSRFASPLGRRYEPLAPLSLSSPDQPSLASLAAEILAMKIDHVVMMLTLVSDLLDAANVDLWHPESTLAQPVISAELLLDLVKAASIVRFAAIEILKGAALLVACLDADETGIVSALTAKEPILIALGIPDYIARLIRIESAVEVVGQEEVSMLDMAKQICEQWQLRDPGLLLALGTRVDQHTAAAAAAQSGVEQATGLEGKLEAFALDQADPDRTAKSAVEDDNLSTTATPASTPGQAGVPGVVGLTKERMGIVCSGETRSKVDKFVEGMATADPVTVLRAVYEQFQPRTVSTFLPDEPTTTTTEDQGDGTGHAPPGMPDAVQFGGFAAVGLEAFYSMIEPVFSLADFEAADDAALQRQCDEDDADGLAPPDLEDA